MIPLGTLELDGDLIPQDLVIKLNDVYAENTEALASVSLNASGELLVISASGGVTRGDEWAYPRKIGLGENYETRLATISGEINQGLNPDEWYVIDTIIAWGVQESGTTVSFEGTLEIRPLNGTVVASCNVYLESIGDFGEYLAVAGVGNATHDNFILLEHTTPGSLSLSDSEPISGLSGRATTMSHSGTYVAATADNVVYLMSISEGLVTIEDSYTITVPDFEARVAIDFGPNDDYLVVGDEDGKVTLLDHTTPGTLILADSLTVEGNVKSVGFSHSGNYIAVGHTLSPGFTLLDHTTLGTITVAATYTLAGGSRGVGFSPTDDYIAVGSSSSPDLVLLDHTTPGTVTLADEYTISKSVQDISFTNSGDYIAMIATSGELGSELILLDHTIPGTVTLADSFAISETLTCVAVSTSDNYIAAGTTNIGSKIYLVDHTTPGTLVAGTEFIYDDSVNDLSFGPIA